MLEGPFCSLGRFFGLWCQVPVKIITADGCKKNKPVITIGNSEVQ